MKMIKAVQLLQQTGKRIFTLSDLRNLFGTVSPNSFKDQIQTLVRATVLERIIKGYYVLSSDRPTDFELANVLYRPSYVSLESALNYYGILIQAPQEVTSITTKLATAIEANGKRYSYAHLDSKYFSGYQKVDNFLIATPEKALVDTLYFAALGKASCSLEELNLAMINRTKVKQFSTQIINRAFRKYFASIKL